MAEHQPPIEPEVAGHLVASMNEAPRAEGKRPEPPSAADGQTWPDGSGKHRHPKDHDRAHGQQGQQATDGPVHRQSRPQLPHHD